MNGRRRALCCQEYELFPQYKGDEHVQLECLKRTAFSGFIGDPARKATVFETGGRKIGRESVERNCGMLFHWILGVRTLLLLSRR